MKKTGLLLSLFLAAQFAFAQPAVSVVKTGNGAPILFLPGFTAPGSVWDETVRHLDGAYQSHTVSYAGFNGLPSIGTPWYEALRKGLVEYIRREKLSGITLIGHSMGGNLATDLAAELPEQVRGLILVESIPCMRDLMMPGVPAASLQYASPYNDKILAMSAEDFKKMAVGMSRNMTNTPARVDLLTHWALEADRQTYVYGYTDLLKLDLRDKLAAIRTPTLILGAAFPNKEVVSATYEKQYAGLKNKEVRLADGSRHFIMFDQPEWLYTQVNDYLKHHVRP